MAITNAAQVTSSAILGKLTGTGVKIIHSTVSMGLTSGNAYFKVPEVTNIDHYVLSPTVLRTTTFSGSTTSGTLMCNIEHAKFTTSGAYNEIQIKVRNYALAGLSGAAGDTDIPGLETRVSGQTVDVVVFGR